MDKTRQNVFLIYEYVSERNILSRFGKYVYDELIFFYQSFICFTRWLQKQRMIKGGGVEQKNGEKEFMRKYGLDKERK